MKVFLLKMSVVGIKNIDKEIEINFYKNTLTKKFDVSNSHVKAIYGSNGAGKTGIVYAVDIYQNLVMNPKYLTVCNANGSLASLINQKTKQFKINMIFISFSDDKSSGIVLSHQLVVEEVNNEYKIVEEKLSELSGANLNNLQKYSTIYHIKEGKIVELLKKCEYIEELELKTMNLLSNQSLLCAIVTSNIHNEKIELDMHLLAALKLLVNFVSHITVVLQESDIFIDYNNIVEQLSHIAMLQTKKEQPLISSAPTHIKKLPDIGTKQIEKSKIDQYKKQVSNLSAFIKVFNDDLLNIEIKKDENGDYYECENIMIYKNKRISEKFESTGIKKLIKLYSALCDLNNGKIVFIDEFDANIHDVLLVKLVDYIMQYSQGQFIFTTHNLDPMDVLKTAKNSIDFLSSDSRIVSWTKNGHYTPASQYSKGLIKYSPFNIEPYNFLGVFGDGQE